MPSFLHIGGTIWAAPTSAVGLFLGACCRPWGARFTRHTGVIEIHGPGVSWMLEHCTLLEGGALAITFGEVVLARAAAAHDLTRSHERIHVRQCRRWGPFFIPAYLAASGIALLRGRNAYRGNAFEVEAYAQENAG